MNLVEDKPRSFVRNRYFWGKLLDAEHLELEQRYMNQKRWLVNRLALGTAVLAGLEVELAAGGRAWIRPGVALDPCGREIVVAESFCVEHPTQPTDECGDPVGDPVGPGGAVWLCLAYHECDIEPVRALVDGCDPRDGCRPNAVRERFRVLVHTGRPPRPRPFASFDPATVDVLRGAGDVGHGAHAAAAPVVVDPPAGEPPDCVPIALLTVDADGKLEPPKPLGQKLATTLDLLHAVVFLAGRLNQLEQRLAAPRPHLESVAGDAQSGTKDTALGQQIAVAVRDEGGQGLPDVQVSFRVTGGGGTLAAAAVATDPNGSAAVEWKLGPAAGLNSAEAVLPGGADRISFYALAT